MLVTCNVWSQDSLRYRTLEDFLNHSTLSGSARAYFMATDNLQDLSDYTGSAFGAGIKMISPDIRGFSLEMSGFFIQNIHSSDFTHLDSITKNPNRYELGLFDVTDPSNINELSTLDEFNVKFESKKWRVKAGRYVPENLFINAQDGRMRPTIVRGFQAIYSPKNWELEVEFIDKVSPRSTVKTYLVEESFGIYPSGRNSNGQPSDYAGNIQTPGIFIGQANYKFAKKSFATLGILSVPNVFQTYYFQTEHSLEDFYGGLLVIGQHPLNGGGNKDASKAYAADLDKTLLLSSQLGKRFGRHSLDINLTNIRSKGRFLMPREWGREYFYTFMPRERNEGTGGTLAFSGNLKLAYRNGLKTQFSYGRFYLPELGDAARNKYAMPSYEQWNWLTSYAFQKYLKGLTARALYVRKNVIGALPENPNAIFNKVNLSLYNIILDFTF